MSFYVDPEPVPYKFTRCDPGRARGADTWSGYPVCDDEYEDEDAAGFETREWDEAEEEEIRHPLDHYFPHRN